MPIGSFLVVRAWQLRVAAAPAVDAYMDSGWDESGFVAVDDVSSFTTRATS